MISRSARAEAYIERGILNGELQPGDRLPTEDDLAQAMELSRTAVRDAMRSLATRGLITVRHGVGMQVAPPSRLGLSHAFADLLTRSDVTVGDALEARRALDVGLAPLTAANATEADIGRLRAALDRFGEAVSAADSPAAQEAHLDFHIGLYRALHLSVLELLLEAAGEVILLSSLRPSDDSSHFELSSHQPILAAVEGHDPTALTVAIEEHYGVTDGQSYSDFRTVGFRDLVTHDDFVTLRRRISQRAASSEEVVA